MKTVVVVSQTALLAALFAVGLAASGCPTPTTGEGEGEGEGAPAGEGEGSPGEGEGSPGEGEGSPGEGEGSPGEGEGEGGGLDTVGDETNPTDITVSVGADFTTTTAIDSDGDRDCYRFTTTDTLVVTAETSGTCVTGEPDTEIDVEQVAGDGSTTQVGHNDDDPNGAAGDHCSVAQAAIDPGTYLVCVFGFFGSTGPTDLTVSLAAQTTLNAGDACVKGDIAAVCDAGASLQCLDDGTGTTTCAAPTTLNASDPCVIGNEIAVCDATQGLECLSVSSPTDFQCQVPTTLNVNDPCVVGATAAVCDPTGNLDCVDDGSGGGTGTCQSRAAALCAAAVDVTGQLPFQTTIGDTNVVAGSCTAVDRFDTMLRFVVDNSAPLQSLTVTATGATAVSVETTCGAPASELGCNTTDTTTTSPVAAGTELFILVEQETAGTPVTVDVTSTPVQILGVGDACTIGSTTAVCDASQNLECADLGGGGACVLPQTFSGSLDDADPTWSRASSTCGTTTTVEPFDAYTVTNSTGADVTLQVTMHAPGNPGACAFDTLAWAFTDPFDAGTGQCISGDDDGGVGACPLLTTTVAAGATIDVVVSPFGSGRGAYDIEFVTAGGDVTVTPQ